MGSARLVEVWTLIERSLERGALPICVFDLDSTLFSTGPRNLQILREFLAEHGRAHPELLEAAREIGLADMGWNIHESLAARGIGEPELWEALRRFWEERFFTDDYLLHDTQVPGAVEYVLACHQRGALIYYLTGRHVGGMEIGTVRALTRQGFPFWRGRCVLHLKPSFEMGDRAFKDDALQDIRSYRGQVVATFENEPANANLFARAFPEALHFLLLTVHSPKPEKPIPELILSEDFRFAEPSRKL
jgi:haloacid dehalogenase-like hydrolase